MKINLKKHGNIAQKTFCTLRLRFAWDDKLIQIVDKYNNDNDLFWSFIDISHISIRNRTKFNNK